MAQVSKWTAAFRFELDLGEVVVQSGIWVDDLIPEDGQEVPFVPQERWDVVRAVVERTTSSDPDVANEKHHKYVVRLYGYRYTKRGKRTLTEALVPPLYHRKVSNKNYKREVTKPVKRECEILVKQWAKTPEGREVVGAQL